MPLDGWLMQSLSGIRRRKIGRRGTAAMRHVHLTSMCTRLRIDGLLVLVGGIVRGIRW